jgi:hypothetical protein
MTENLRELQKLLDDFERESTNLIGLRNILNGRLNYPTEGTIIPHELIDSYYDTMSELRSEFCKGMVFE